MDTLVMVMQMVFYPVLSVRWYLACSKNGEPDAYRFLTYALMGTLGIVGVSSIAYAFIFMRAVPSGESVFVGILLFTASILLYYLGMHLHFHNIAFRSGINVVRTLSSPA
jgi:predicted membrane channel-forming protein YqfA (hemolysin III family)